MPSAWSTIRAGLACAQLALCRGGCRNHAWSKDHRHNKKSRHECLSIASYLYYAGIEKDARRYHEFTAPDFENQRNARSRRKRMNTGIKVVDLSSHSDRYAAR